MSTTTSPLRHRTAVLAALGAGFAIAYTQQPLYHTNQNTYFLQGMANAGHGSVARDWMTTTADPFPVFTAFVTAVHGWGLADGIYVVQGLLLAMYFVALLGITARMAGFALASDEPRMWWTSGLIILVHAAVARGGPSVLADFDRLLHFGVAAQHVITEYLEPSTIGVFLLAAVWAAMAGRVTLAGAAAGVAVAVHPSYLLSAVVVLAVATVHSIRGARVGTGRAAGRGVAPWIVFAVLAGPTLYHAAQTFAGGDPEVVARARDILITERFPHHALPSVWMDWRVGLQGAWIVLATGIAARGMSGLLRDVLVVGLVVVVLGIALQVATGSHAVALLFPWRVSTLLVPIATAVIAGAVAARLCTLPNVALVVILLAPIVLGGFRMLARLATPPRGFPAFAAQLANSLRGFDDPLCLTAPDGLDKFRLATGLPIVADFKTHPYRSDEVVEWWDRLAGVRAFDAATGEATCATLDSLLQTYPITHVVTLDRPLPACDRLTRWFGDDHLTAYRVRPAE